MTEEQISYIVEKLTHLGFNTVAGLGVRDAEQRWPVGGYGGARWKGVINVSQTRPVHCWARARYEL